MIFSSIILVQANDLEIQITDLIDQEISEINENEHFKISVFDLDQIETPYLIDVNLLFNGLPYTIGETAEIILQAPEVDSDITFEISASKVGYNSTNKSITILNNESHPPTLGLIILPEFFTVEAGQKFKVDIVDENGISASGVSVAIQSYGDIRITDDNGRAWLTAPDDIESITILAQKDGYSSGEIDIEVNIPRPWWNTFLISPYFPIIVAIIFLLIAILFVNHRQKKSVYTRAKKISDEKTLERYDAGEISTSEPYEFKKEKLKDYTSLKELVRTTPDHDPKVEEIRISRLRKEKQIVPVESEEYETEKVVNKKKLQKHDYDWFEGKDNVRYEIDKLTGKVDENGIDKWYEGIDDLREKIDEKVKKKDKKRIEGKEE
jgi:uncharacterized membrane protein